MNKKFNQKLKLNYNEVVDFLENLNPKIFEIKEAGKSFDGRSIYTVKAGTGKTKILIWSQMHGNEPVSTKALLDLFDFLQSNDELANKILTELSITAIPMLNPDGAEKFIRRNSQNIDINRDAIRLCTPEARLLHSVAVDFKPDYAFNLHDQERYYGVKNSDTPTTMSFLSPSFDEKRTIDHNRKTAMQIIASTTHKLRRSFENITIARYSDAFMASAFGDFMQSQGFKTILFEGGFIMNDKNREKVRNIYFNALRFALESIISSDFHDFSEQDYLKIPENIRHHFTDILLKNISIEKNNKKFVTDISIKRKIIDTEQFTDLITDYIIDNIGDLSNLKAFAYHDCSNITVKDDNNQIKRLENADFLLEYIKNEFNLLIV